MSAENCEIVEDGFGGRWVKHGPDCDLQVVRPGKVQCSCPPERTPPFPEIDPDDNEVFLDGLHEITTRWHAKEITATQATAELRELEARHGR